MGGRAEAANASTEVSSARVDSDGSIATSFGGSGRVEVGSAIEDIERPALRLQGPGPRRLPRRRQRHRAPLPCRRQRRHQLRQRLERPTFDCGCGPAPEPADRARGRRSGQDHRLAQQSVVLLRQAGRGDAGPAASHRRDRSQLWQRRGPASSVAAARTPRDRLRVQQRDLRLGRRLLRAPPFRPLPICTGSPQRAGSTPRSTRGRTRPSPTSAPGGPVSSRRPSWSSVLTVAARSLRRRWICCASARTAPPKPSSARAALQLLRLVGSSRLRSSATARVLGLGRIVAGRQPDPVAVRTASPTAVSASEGARQVEGVTRRRRPEPWRG